MHFIGGSAPGKTPGYGCFVTGALTSFGCGLFTLREKDGGRFVGEAGLAHFRRGLGDQLIPSRKVPWALARSAHGKGYGTEAPRPSTTGSSSVARLAGPSASSIRRIWLRCGWVNASATSRSGRPNTRARRRRCSSGCPSLASGSEGMGGSTGKAPGRTAGAGLPGFRSASGWAGLKLIGRLARSRSPSARHENHVSGPLLFAALSLALPVAPWPTSR